jgi:shikimate kinase
MKSIDKIIYENGSSMGGMFYINDNIVQDLNGNTIAIFLKWHLNMALCREIDCEINQPLIDDVDIKLKPKLTDLFQILTELIDKYDQSKLTDKSNSGFNNIDQVEIMAQQCLDAVRQLKKNFYIQKTSGTNCD